MKNFSVEEKVFRTSPYFIFGCTNEELKTHVKRVVGLDIPTPENSVGTQITMMDKKNRRVRILWMKDIPKSRDTTATLVHELFHLVVRICKDKGVPIVANIESGECGDETAAYLIEFFYEEIMERLSRKSTRKKKRR